MRARLTASVGVALAVSLSVTSFHASDNLGKIFIKAAVSEVNGQQIPDQALEDSANTMRKRAGDFTLAKEETEADFLLMVVERKNHGSSGEIRATLSVKDATQWKPVTMLTGQSGLNWNRAAGDVMKKAEEWAKAHSKK